MRKLFTLYLLLSGIITAAQVPANNDCINAVLLTPSTNEACATTTVGTTLNATASSIPNCDAQPSVDVWYKFVATQSYHKIVVRDATPSYLMNIQFFNGSSIPANCSNLQSLGCISNNFSGDSVVYKAYNLIAGQIYYVQVFTNNTANTGTFDICITSPSTPSTKPVNDSCSNATILIPVPNADFVVTTAGTGTCVGATPSLLDCYSRQSDDVWYKFRAISSNHKIVVKGAGGFYSNGGLFEYYPNGCNSGTYTGACVYNSVGGDSLIYKMSRLTIGQWYYEKVATNALNDIDRQFNICITTPQVPVNDECVHAVLLPTFATWHPVSGTTTEATGYFYDYDCNGNRMNDVWYKFVATTATHKIIVKDLAFVEHGGQIQLFSGDCNNMQSVGCSGSYAADSIFYEASGLMVGETYYFKVYAPSTALYEGTFNICVVGGSDPVTGCNYTVPIAVPFPSLPLVTNSGNICDHNGDLDYDINTNGYTIIKPAMPGDWVKLTFTMFNTADNSDVVTIYNGEGTSGTILYSGYGMPNPLPSVTANGPLTIQFVSDGSGTAPGFTAAITNPANPCNTAPSTVYVDSAITASGNGSAWDKAYKTLNEALFVANTCTNVQQIYVRKGTYYPGNYDGTATTSRDSSFRILRNGIKIYGGFSPDNNSAAGYRNPANIPSILSGDIGVLNENVDNSYHVITVEPLSGTAIDTSSLIDGFYIKNGNADGVAPYKESGGGGIYLQGQPYECSPFIKNCVFTDNSAGFSGGAMMVNGIGAGSSCNPLLQLCKFENNNSQYGGAVSIGGYDQGGRANVNISDCLFKNNNAIAQGGAIYIDGNYGESSDSVLNCIFSGNSSSYSGGAVHIDLTDSYRSELLWMNCVFTNNTATTSGGAVSIKEKAEDIKFINSTFNGNKTNNNSDDVIQFIDFVPSIPARIKNCIFGNDLIEADSRKFLVTNSLINRVMPLNLNNLITGNPVFINALDPDGPDNIFGTKDDGLMISRTSPALNKGDNSAITVEKDTLDILHKNRKYGPAIDMGAYEVYDDPVYAGPCPSPANHIVYVDSSILTSGDGSSWVRAYKTLSEALYIANQCSVVDSILVAKGTYYPVNYDGSFSDSRFNFFPIFRNNIKLYGGFPAGGLGTRDPAAHSTILSGDYKKNDNGFINNDENSYHILVIYPDSLAVNSITAANTIVDGISFKGGNANRPYGDGVSTDIRGREIVFVVGGAIYNKSQYPSFAESSPLINNCTFINNSGTNGGGAIYSTGGVGITSPTFTNCFFLQNRGAPGALGGGAVFIDAYPSILTNTLRLKSCVFEDNNAGSVGGGLGGAVLAIYKANVLADNTVFSKNIAGQGAAVLLQFDGGNSVPVFNNCLFNKNMAFISGSVFNGVKGDFNNCTFNQNTSILPAVNEIFGNPGTNNEPLKNFNITNCIFNVDTIYENNIGGTVTSKYHIRNTLINQRAFDLTGKYNMITSDPHFEDANNEIGSDNKFGTADDGLRLSNISPCVNAGDITGFGIGFPPTDIRNEDRIYNNGVIDMGCYEFQGAMNSNVPLSIVTSPVSRNVSNDPVVVINNNNGLIAKMVNQNANAIPFLNQYNVTQIVHPFTANTYQPYLKFSYHISQENGAASLPAGNTLKVTVYFTQPDFDDYNLNNGNDPDMPTGPLDVNRFSNVRISQYHGNLLPGCNLQDITPSCYTGTATSLTPDLVAWNSGQNRWEISFSVSSFSGFYFTTKVSDPLPLTLISFDGIKKDKLVQLNWVTSQETNTSHFIVQRSNSGSLFTSFSRVEAKSIAGYNHYRLTDADAMNGLNYYRLYMVDKDGTIALSPIIKISFDPHQELQLVPNPATNFITLSGIENKGTIQIFAMDGKLIKRLTAMTNTERIDISSLSKGFYMIEFRSAGRVENLKFFKQ